MWGAFTRMVETPAVMAWQCLKSLEGHRDGVLAVAIGRDQRVVVSGGRDGELRVWDEDDGKDMWRFAGGGGGFRALLLRAMGRLLRVDSLTAALGC